MNDSDGGADVGLGQQAVAPRHRIRFLENGPSDGEEEQRDDHQHDEQVKGQQRIHVAIRNRRDPRGSRR